MKFFQYIYQFFYTAYKLLIPDSNMYLLRNSMGYMNDSSYNDVYANISADYNGTEYNPIAYAPPLPPYPYRQISLMSYRPISIMSYRPISIMSYRPISIMPYIYCNPLDYPFNLNYHKRKYFKYQYNKRRKNRDLIRDIQYNNDIDLPVT